MLNSSMYIIKDNEKFSPENHPGVVHELSDLIQEISNTSIYYKVEIIVSFLKDHSLKTAWIEANPALTQMVTSGLFKTSHLESLFESCRRNKAFCNEFEEYISRQLLMRRRIA